MTVQNSGTRRMEFTEDIITKSQSSGKGSGGGFTFKEQNNIDYLLNRDPMQEFFNLTCQAIKLNSPQMNVICSVDTKQLYLKAQKMGIPFFKWATWIEDFLNKEFMRNVLKTTKRDGISSKPTSKTFQQAEKLHK